MKTQTITVCASLFSGITLIACLAAVMLIYSDVRGMWTELDSDINYFKVFTDDLWRDMIQLSAGRQRQRRQSYGAVPIPSGGSYEGGGAPPPLRPIQPPTGEVPPGAPAENLSPPIQRVPNTFSTGDAPGGGSIVNSGKFIGSPGSQCNCRADNQCPSGSKGPKGPPGHAGEDGIPGIDGKTGQDAQDAEPQLAASKVCYNCPAGPPGSPGPPGHSGPRGMRGAHGGSGQPGRDGQPGLPGEMGAPGPAGRDGLAGAQGDKGEDAEQPVSRRGQKGATGEVGDTGENGGQGATGADGISGPEGVSGPPGLEGIAGAQGDEGPPGIPGGPGHDAEYCPCPKRGRL